MKELTQLINMMAFSWTASPTKCQPFARWWSTLRYPESRRGDIEVILRTGYTAIVLSRLRFRWERENFEDCLCCVSICRNIIGASPAERIYTS